MNRSPSLSQPYFRCNLPTLTITAHVFEVIRFLDCRSSDRSRAPIRYPSYFVVCGGLSPSCGYLDEVFLVWRDWCENPLGQGLKPVAVTNQQLQLDRGNLPGYTPWDEERGFSQKLMMIFDFHCRFLLQLQPSIRHGSPLLCDLAREQASLST